MICRLGLSMGKSVQGRGNSAAKSPDDGERCVVDEPVRR